MTKRTSLHGMWSSRFAFILAVAGIMLFLIPQFESIFASFDLELGDVFAIQEQIAADVVNQLGTGAAGFTGGMD